MNSSGVNGLQFNRRTQPIPVIQTKRSSFKNICSSWREKKRCCFVSGMLNEDVFIKIYSSWFNNSWKHVFIYFQYFRSRSFAEKSEQKNSDVKITKQYSFVLSLLTSWASQDLFYCARITPPGETNLVYRKTINQSDLMIKNRRGEPCWTVSNEINLKQRTWTNNIIILTRSQLDCQFPNSFPFNSIFFIIPPMRKALWSKGAGYLKQIIFSKKTHVLFA